MGFSMHNSYILNPCLWKQMKISWDWVHITWKFQASIMVVLWVNQKKAVFWRKNEISRALRRKMISVYGFFPLGVVAYTLMDNFSDKSSQQMVSFPRTFAWTEGDTFSGLFWSDSDTCPKLIFRPYLKIWKCFPLGDFPELLEF